MTAADRPNPGGSRQHKQPDGAASDPSLWSRLWRWLPQARMWGGRAKTRRSETRYRAALITDPASRSALWGLGRLLLRERRFEDALPIWRAACCGDPASAVIAKTMTRFRAANSSWARVAGPPSPVIVTIVSPEPASR